MLQYTSKASMSNNDANRFFFATALTSGTTTPRKRSPSPYSPTPHLKNRGSTTRFSSE